MVRELLSSTEGSGGDSPAPLKSYTEKFQELFPFYLSLGMTEEQYWDRDCQLVAAYRKADEIRENRKNRDMWALGMYIYDTLLRAAPIPVGFVKKGTKRQPYIPEPYAITEKQAEVKREEKERKVYEKGKRLMESWMANTNKKFERK